MIKKTIKTFEKQRIGIAAEIFSSAFCPLNCKYCYIPKTELIKNLQKEIIRKIEDKTFITDIKKAYGENLQYLGLWGAEPTITLNSISKLIPELIENFSKLKDISFSTSLITDPDIILNFIKVLEKEKRNIKFDCQISLDGPAFITDINRTKGVTQKIQKNFFYIIKELNKINLKNLNVLFKFKATLTPNNIEALNKKPTKIKEYFDFFDTIFERYKKENKNKKVKLPFSANSTLTVPGKYTSTDGKNLAIFFRNLRTLAEKNKKNHYWKNIDGSLNTYTYRFDKLIRSQQELSTKPYMFTCSGGDTNFGLGINQDLHICHRMFYLNNKEYINSVLSQKNIDNWDVSIFNKGNIDLVNNNYTINTKNKKNQNRVLYILRNYHDFTRLKNSYIITMLKELALAEQANKKYFENDEFCLMFAIFINSALACHAENLLNTGVVHFNPVSIIRLFANGAFSEVLKDYYENFSERK